ncbi:MAG: PilT/PilU family type 4a pilus ATPase [Planctomycetaceae bacterium]|nr:PilT/PilU family type 4a pilus ATPase [Planctomycetaceae bacterium]
MTDKKQPIDTHVHLEMEPEINKFFKACVKAQASDLHLKAGQPPKLRMRDGIKNTNGEPLDSKKIENLVFEIISDKQKQFFMENGALDFAYEFSDSDRFRINIFKQRTKISLVARRITSKIPPFESLHLPPMVQKIAETAHEGLVLVTGPTGCGKSTTLASMIDHINTLRSCHIVTIEDPLEFVHMDKKAIVSQREIGIDVLDYGDAMRSLMRQDPDVVLIGEMRDRETFTAAMRAAETGHLVFGTMHSASASQTIQRILDLFPQDERDLARQTFSMAFQAIISQVILPSIKKDCGRVPAVEVLLTNPIVRKLIADKREAELGSVMRACQNEGMQDFTESLKRLVETDWIDLKTALGNAPNVEELKMSLKGIRASAGVIL